MPIVTAPVTFSQRCYDSATVDKVIIDKDLSNQQKIMKISEPKFRQPIPKNAHKVFDGRLFTVWQWQQTLFDGTTATFEKIRHQPSTSILPVTSQGKVILTHQEQPGRGHFIGALGGIVDPGEDILAAAKRELLEESGYTATAWHLFAAMQLGDKIDWPVYVFIVKGLSLKAKPTLEPGERIQLVEYTYPEFLKVVSSPDYRDLEISLKILRLLQSNSGKRKLFYLFRP